MVWGLEALAASWSQCEEGERKGLASFPNKQHTADVAKAKGGDLFSSSSKRFFWQRTFIAHADIEASQPAVS